MLSIEYISDYILKEKITLIGSVVKNEVYQEKYLAFVEVNKIQNLQFPSNSKLNSLKEHFAKDGIQIDFILIDAHNRDIEAGIRATILHNFGNSVRNAFLSIEGNNAFLWIVPKRSLSIDEMESLKEKSQKNLTAVGKDLVSIHTTSEANTPSKTACLSIIRTISPAKIDFIILTIRSKGFIVPSDDWMARMLDNLRKGSFIVRRKDGAYALSLAGLKAGGTLKNARSPDIVRMLALARRRR